MTRFELHDTKGTARMITTDESAAALRNLLGMFKTECAVKGGAYEYNHFVNWARKYHGVHIEFNGGSAERIDM